jgi:hypothetical protein
MAALTGGKRKQGLLALGAALALNLALLGSMAFGVRDLGALTESPPVQLTLLPPLPRPALRPQVQPQPQSKAAAARPQPALKVLTRPPEPRAAAAGVAAGPAPVPAEIAPEPKAPPGPPGDVQGVLKETVGCDDPDGYHLTKAQRASCEARLTAHAKEAPNLFGLNIPPDKLAAFDRAARCHEQNRGGAMPAPDDNMGVGTVPRLRDCPPGDR